MTVGFFYFYDKFVIEIAIYEKKCYNLYNYGRAKRKDKTA